MEHHVGRVLISRDRINDRVAELGQKLSEDLAAALRAEGDDTLDHPDRVVMVPVLTGAIVFVADLVRHMPLKMSLRLVSVSSYPGQSKKSKGASLRGALPNDLEGRHVVVVDDILDSGQTLALVQEAIMEQNPASLRFCVLLDKQVEKTVDMKAEYTGFEIPDEFVVGYGLDYDGFYRNLPDIMVLAEDHR